MNKLKKELNSQNIFYYILVFFLIMIIVITVLGGYLFRYYYTTVYTDFQSGNKEHLTSIVNRHENDIQILKDIATQIGLSDDVSRFRLSEQPQKAIHLEEQLRRYTTVSQFFGLLLYWYHEDNYLYNFSTSIGLSSFLGSGCVLEKLSAENFRALLAEPKQQLYILPEQNVDGAWINGYMADRQKIIYLLDIPPSLEETLIFIVPASYYDSLLSRPGNGEPQTDFLYYNGSLIVSRGDEADTLPEQELCALLAGRSDSSEKIRLGSRRYLLSVQTGDSGILYGSLQPMSVFHDKVMAEQWGITLIVLICAIPAIFIVTLAAGSVMRRVRRMNLLLNEESHYDLDSIENGIQLLVTSYRDSEKESQSLKKTRFISDFVRGSYSSRQEAIAAAQECGLNINYKLYLAILTKSREISNENRVYSDMLEAIAGESRTDGFGIHLIGNNQNLFLLFADKKEEIEGLLTKLLSIGKRYDPDYIMAVSDYHCSFEESSRAYLEANTAFDNYLLLDNSKIIRFSDVSQKDYTSLIDENDLNRLKTAIRNRDKKAAHAVVKDICDRLNGEKASLYAFRILYNDLMHTLLVEWKGDKTEFDDFYNVFTLSQCLNIQDFYELLCDACSMIIDNREGIGIQNSDIVQKAIAYMQDHFSDPGLNMNALAEYLQVSAVTLSVEFRNELDIRPSDYLTTLRMEKAKELLRETNMLIGDITLAVGYEDAHVFRRRFKQYTGMTPGQYREQ